MPIYEYRCSSCGHELEALQKLSEAPLVACPSCKADALVKLMSASGFQLKGSGWYATDFKSGGKPAAKTSDADATSGAESKSGTESKPGTESKSGVESKPGPESKPGAQAKADSAATPKSGDKAPAAATASGASS